MTSGLALSIVARVGLSGARLRPHGHYDMLFHTLEFLLAFLPLSLIGYFALGRASSRLARAWLALVSLVFYGSWDSRFVLVILGSIIGNFVAAQGIDRLLVTEKRPVAKWILAAAISVNLLVLAHFKYLTFLVNEANHLFDTRWDMGHIVLPIGISFFTFTQIAYLVDLYQGKVRERSFLDYLLFVTYFPHLVAGPVLHHAEMMPQFARVSCHRINPMYLARGVTFLAFGLFKKVVLADGCAPIADAAFNTTAGTLGTVDAWIGAIAYTLQIYYDFSGYSDMAIGVSLLFNIRLPINFDSPYRARSIIEFWRRWHITLSRFLRDYLYIPLGGNRAGSGRRYVNLLTTMLLGGFWHGANWTFVVWGGLHGFYLCVNHLWRYLSRNLRCPAGVLANVVPAISGLLTLLAVIVAWVFFRSSSVADALDFVRAMLRPTEMGNSRLYSEEQVIFLGVLMAWAAWAPNSNAFMHYRFGAPKGGAVDDTRWSWKPNLGYAVLAGILFYSCAFLGLTGREKLEFLYFQF